MAARRTRSRRVELAVVWGGLRQARVSRRTAAISSTGCAREPVAPIVGELDVRQAADAPAVVKLVRAASDRGDGRRAARRCPRRSRGSARQQRRRAARRARIGRPTAMYSKTLPERTPFPRRPRPGSAAGGPRSRAAARATSRAERRAELEPVAEVERLGPGAVALPEVAEEPCDDVETRACECLEERARVTPPEEAARVRDAKTLGRVSLEPGDVVEVGSVRNRDDRPARLECARLLGDRLGDARDRVRARLATSRATRP